MPNPPEAVSISAGSTVRIGIPAEQPEEIIAALKRLFSSKDNVQFASLGLMEVIDPDRKSEFTYTIGIACSANEADVIREAFEVVQTVPTGRWPVTIVTVDSQFFPNNIPPFFGELPKRGWLHRVLHFDLNSLWTKSKPATPRQQPAATASHDLESAIARAAAEPSQTNRELFYEALFKNNLCVGIKDLPNGVSSFPTMIDKDTSCAMATSISSEGTEVLLAFTNPNAVHARNPELGFLEMPGADLLGIMVENELGGVFMNSASQWLELSSSEIRKLLVQNQRK